MCGGEGGAAEGVAACLGQPWGRRLLAASHKQGQAVCRDRLRLKVVLAARAALPGQLQHALPKGLLPAWGDPGEGGCWLQVTQGVGLWVGLCGWGSVHGEAGVDWTPSGRPLQINAV